jgi:hypothetical protein
MSGISLKQVLGRRPITVPGRWPVVAGPCCPASWRQEVRGRSHGGWFTWHMSQPPLVKLSALFYHQFLFQLCASTGLEHGWSCILPCCPSPQ